MLRFGPFLALALAAGLLASCETTRSSAEGRELGTHAAMRGWIDQASHVIWDFRSRARSETQRIDPTLVDDQDWLKLTEASRSLEFHFRRLARLRSVPIEMHASEQPDFPSQREIQSRINADPAWFRKVSMEMADNARELSLAAEARDPQRASDLIENLNQPCQTCHTRYWVKTVH